MSAAILFPMDSVGSSNYTSNFTTPDARQCHGIACVVIETVMASQRGKVSAAILGAMFAILLVAAALAPKLDNEEPTILKPRVPLIGHMYGLMVGQTAYLLGLFRNSQTPASTLSMGNGKMYALFTTELIHSALKNKHLSIEPFNEEAAGKLCNLDADAQDRILKPKGDQSVFQVLRTAQLTTMQGDGLNQLGSAILRELAEQVNGFDIDTGRGLVVPNLHLWIRSWLSPVHSRALYGKHDPYAGRPDLYDDFWVFEDATAALIASPYPRFTQSKAWHCRERVQAASKCYYAAKHDQDDSVAPFIRARAAALRDIGLTAEDIARIEFFQFGAATGNSNASLMWVLLYIFGDRNVVERIRQELLPLVEETEVVDENGQRNKEVKLNIASVEEQCPFLLACWKEALRVVNVHTSVRRVVEDTYVSDGSGIQYLLKKGHDVVMPHAVAHRYDSRAWGPEQDALEFRPENFLPSTARSQARDCPEGSKAVDKARRAAWIPFGGGVNLCPGRRIVLIEHLAFISTLILGFEVESINGDGIKPPKAMPMGLGHPILRPVENAKQLGVHIKRRAGWENTVWSYDLGKTTRQEF